MLAIDLGSRTTKAVHMQRSKDGFTLSGYALLDAPIYDKNLPSDLLAEHLKAISQALPVKSKTLTLTVGVNDAVLRHVEMPPMPADDIRQVLKLNSRVYMQQDMTGWVFDSYLEPSSSQQQAAAKAKQKVLVAATRKQLVEEYITACRSTGFIPDHIVPMLVGPINAFERAVPESFSGQVVALVDIGFKSTSISILQSGELILNRVVAIGGDRMTAGLAESMNISYAEAEGLKIGMPHEVQAMLEPLVTPLGRELRASVDFFEHQQERPVTHVYVSGGSARSPLVMDILKQEMMVDCTTWNPTKSLTLALPADRATEVEHVAPQLTVAIGAALAAL
jgi:type IV pilus assembly protein PilM